MHSDSIQIGTSYWVKDVFWIWIFICFKSTETKLWCSTSVTTSMAINGFKKGSIKATRALETNERFGHQISKLLLFLWDKDSVGRQFLYFIRSKLWRGCQWSNEIKTFLSILRRNNLKKTLRKFHKFWWTFSTAYRKTAGDLT